MPKHNKDLPTSDVHLECLRTADILGVKRKHSLKKVEGGTKFWDLCDKASQEMENDLVLKHVVRLHLLMFADW
jgi:hypothetical protein